ncbi:hypothetical protein ACN4EG_16695 [Alkalinema pantanalense CENA528]|uniref:hypothetical protein n=1 Tax=Alkalinema pantanalense TaxID=1620705 RepID=UPI003D6EFB9A
MSVLGKQMSQRGMTPNDVMNTKGITPWNPGDNSEIRTNQVEQRHRNFSKQEVDGLRVQAAQRTAQAKLNRKAYQSLSKIENADRSDHTAFRGYQTTVAKVTAGKKGADVAKATVLHGLTPAYAKMGYTLGAAANEAQVRVQELQATYHQVNQRWG